MNIDDLTIGEAKALAAMFGSGQDVANFTHVGKKCIVRGYASGVHFGTVKSVNGRHVEIEDARRLWRWDAAPNGISLSEVAKFGPVGGRSKICVSVDCMVVLDAIEIIVCTDVASNVIEEAKVYTP